MGDPHLWPRDPATVNNDFNARNSGAGLTLANTFIWATWTAAGSDYLERLDAGSPVDGGLIDISHVRWATANAITAIDLCAATMGRLFCGNTGPQELDLRQFDRKVNRQRRRDQPSCRLKRWLCREPARSSKPTADELRALLPPSFLGWVKDTLADQRYRDLQRARNPFTHSWLQRRVFGVVGVTPGQEHRTQFVVQGVSQAMNARDMVTESAELALDRVRAFIEVVDQYGR